MGNGSKNVKHEETGLSVSDQGTGELAPSGAMASAQHEIQSAIIVAQRFRRNEETAYGRLMKSCTRPTFAEEATYSFPRGGATVEGPSVNLAREFARIWGNIRYGLEIVREDEESRQIRGWAWDLETNAKVSAEDEFKKLIFRKQGGWVKPDERDLRELTNRRGAILIRNCLLQVLPKDFVEDAILRVKQTLKDGAASDPDAAKKRILSAFSEFNITGEMLGEFLGHAVAQATPDEVAGLRGIYQSIRDGNSTWADYREPAKAEPEKAAVKVTPSEDENRGHGNEGLTLDDDEPTELQTAKTMRRKGGKS